MVLTFNVMKRLELIGVGRPSFQDCHPIGFKLIFRANVEPCSESGRYKSPKSAQGLALCFQKKLAVGPA